MPTVCLQQLTVVWGIVSLLHSYFDCHSRTFTWCIVASQCFCYACSAAHVLDSRLIWHACLILHCNISVFMSYWKRCMCMQLAQWLITAPHVKLVQTWPTVIPWYVLAQKSAFLNCHACMKDGPNTRAPLACWTRLNRMSFDPNANVKGAIKAKYKCFIRKIRCF